jgi:anti-sigma B factor antagonist
MIHEDSNHQNIIRGVRHEGQSIVLEIGGEIDMKYSVELKDKFKELFRERPLLLVVNMTHVDFMDSSGVATLVEALKWCRHNGSELRLVGLSERVRSIFEVCRLDTIFQFYNNESEALSQ